MWEGQLRTDGLLRGARNERIQQILLDLAARQPVAVPVTPARLLRTTWARSQSLPASTWPSCNVLPLRGQKKRTNS